MTEDLFAALDVALFERRDDGRFDIVGRIPVWLPAAESQADLADNFPLLELFFLDCESEWTGQSDVWTEPNPEGGELYLQAVAATLSGRKFIAIRSLPQELFTYQQLAHDFEMAKDKVERLSRELVIKRQEAERATQAKSDFLATMSHEIRTPLNAIIGMADVLSATPLTADQQKCVDVFQRNGVGLLNLINDILDLSKVEAGRVDLESAEMDVREVIARAMEVVEIRVQAKGLSLRQSMAPGVPRYLVGDPNRLRQIIINLLGNSIKFTDHGGLEVHVDFDPDDPRPGRLRFAVSDTGIGIPEDKLGHIFESFSQADSSTTRKYGGTGLGLTISKQLVELMDGRIWVESTIGAGSTFFFTAQFRVQPNQSERSEKDHMPPAQPSMEELEARIDGLRILLADDSEDNRYLIFSYLKRANPVIEIAENGEIAARLFRESRFDIVLMDVEMPVMDGYHATREIRRFEKETGATPTAVLALTAHAFADMAVKGEEAGFTALLTKPIRRVTLLEALVEHMPKVRPLVQGDPPRERAVIQVEEGMEDVVPGYLDKRRKEVALYRAALAAGDLEAIRQLSHKMKGTGSGYGFPVLTELGGALEKAAKDKDPTGIPELLDRFSRYLESIELKYIS